jgi:hypothetical protein
VDVEARGVSLPRSTMSGILAEGFQVGDRDMSILEGLQAGITKTTLLCCVVLASACPHVMFQSRKDVMDENVSIVFDKNYKW